MRHQEAILHLPSPSPALNWRQGHPQTRSSWRILSARWHCLSFPRIVWNHRLQRYYNQSFDAQLLIGSIKPFWLFRMQDEMLLSGVLFVYGPGQRILQGKARKICHLTWSLDLMEMKGALPSRMDTSPWLHDHAMEGFSVGCNIRGTASALADWFHGHHWFAWSSLV